MKPRQNKLPIDPPPFENDGQPTSTPVMTLKRHVQGVSFPRSGHHLLVNFLHHYFGCRFLYCEYYNHCGQIPCANPANNLQKNHDFGLELPTSGAGAYLLQYRHPLYALTSNYFLHLRSLPQQEETLVIGREPVRIWQDFAVKQVERWKAWMRKWILENDSPQVLELAYEDILHRPGDQLSAAVEFMCPSCPADRPRVELLAHQMDICGKRELTDFHHFDAPFFRQLEQRAKAEIQAVGLPLVMSSDAPVPRVPQRRSAA